MILNENTDTSSKSQELLGLCFFYSRKLSHTFLKGQNDHPGLSSVNPSEYLSFYLVNLQFQCRKLTFFLRIYILSLDSLFILFLIFYLQYL